MNCIDVEKMSVASASEYEKIYSCGEYCHSQSFMWGFQEGVEYCENVLYKKMLRYLQEHLMDWVDEDGDPVTESIQNMTKEKFIKDFCNYIENKKT